MIVDVKHLFFKWIERITVTFGCYCPGSLQQLSDSQADWGSNPVLHVRVPHSLLSAKVLEDLRLDTSVSRFWNETVWVNAEEQTADGDVAGRCLRCCFTWPDVHVRGPGGRCSGPSSHHLAPFFIWRHLGAQLRPHACTAILRSSSSALLQWPHDLQRTAGQHGDLRVHLSGVHTGLEVDAGQLLQRGERLALQKSRSPFSSEANHPQTSAMSPLSTGRPSTVCETMGKADIWLMRNFWDIETPRPTLPNFKHVGGLHCKTAGPLQEAQSPHPASVRWLTGWWRTYW